MNKLDDLKIWDSIKILSIPSFDLEKRIIKEELDNENDMLLTANVIEKIIDQRPVVIIDEIDEYGQPWFWVRIKTEYWNQSHSLALMDNDWWELVYSIDSWLDKPNDHKIAEIEYKIDNVMEEFEEDYLSLWEISEKFYNQKKLLDKEYKKLEDSYKQLDKKTWLNKLFEELWKLKNKKD